MIETKAKSSEAATLRREDSRRAIERLEAILARGTIVVKAGQLYGSEVRARENDGQVPLTPYKISELRRELGERQLPLTDEQRLRRQFELVIRRSQVEPMTPQEMLGQMPNPLPKCARGWVRSQRMRGNLSSQTIKRLIFSRRCYL